MNSDQKQTLPPQVQARQPGHEAEMTPRPDYEPRYPGSGRLQGKVALITGGDSGIGRAVAVLFAREGADLAILYLNETEDAQETKRLVEREGRSCLLFSGDVGDPGFCRAAVAQVIQRFGKLDVLVNNAAEQHPKKDIAEITPDQIESTFRTNIYGYFYMVQAAMPHLRKGAAIVNTASVTAYRGSAELLDYSATKGAIVAFTRSLAQKLAGDGVRVNGVAPGPIWTPLIPSTFPAEKVKRFGADTPMKRPGQPNEVAPSYLFLACEDSSYVTGSVLHPNGGDPTEA
ncbi:NAD(P)-dependent dehydrogenase (short-subunit alcohol dehydrogenase family) [Microvirga flocculans]|uniref:NAD(P)-dependent dehydrogenase (Short-subunit alcohol dehydrogenase family) n=1 Tax=Microvirga flocculans TaxID=217168 RepID=A0A7W6N979_9HYPH|nr:SDR family oxidoreductase [Microvirga flocculans]MBB4041492.1 NAD(P)-dependent dehydrogenase (short-subunit alcohol dehydrogenase family) [Microvirga flocculans]